MSSLGYKVYYGQIVRKTGADVNPRLLSAEKRFQDRILYWQEGNLADREGEAINGVLRVMCLQPGVAGDGRIYGDLRFA